MQETQQSNIPPLFIRRKQLQNTVGLSPSQVDRLERAGLCPRRRRIAGGAAVGWLYEEWRAFLLGQPVAE